MEGSKMSSRKMVNQTLNNRPKTPDNITYSKQDIVYSITQRVNDKNNPTTILLPHICNNINAFGAGFARYIDQHYPIVKENFHMLGNKANLGYTQYISVETNKIVKSQIIVCNMIAQNGLINPKNTRPLNYGSLAICMHDIKNYIKNLSKQSIDNMNYEIHAPRFGSGLAGGNWSFIENLIEDIWGNFSTFIYVK